MIRYYIIKDESVTWMQAYNILGIIKRNFIYTKKSNFTTIVLWLAYTIY